VASFMYSVRQQQQSSVAQHINARRQHCSNKHMECMVYHTRYVQEPDYEFISNTEITLDSLFELIMIMTDDRKEELEEILLLSLFNSTSVPNTLQACVRNGYIVNPSTQLAATLNKSRSNSIVNIHNTGEEVRGHFLVEELKYYEAKINKLLETNVSVSTLNKTARTTLAIERKFRNCHKKITLLQEDMRQLTTISKRCLRKLQRITAIRGVNTSNNREVDPFAIPANEFLQNKKVQSMGNSSQHSNAGSEIGQKSQSLSSSGISARLGFSVLSGNSNQNALNQMNEEIGNSRDHEYDLSIL